MIQVTISNLCEARMGTPYLIGDATVKGDWEPTLPGFGYLNLVAYTDDRSCAALVSQKFRTSNNESGLSFNVVIIDSIEKKLYISDLILGGCNAIEFVGHLKIKAIAWIFDPKGGYDNPLTIDNFKLL